MSSANNIQRGKAAILFFHNEALKFPDNYSMTYKELLDYLNDQSPNFFDSLGASIGYSNLNDTVIQAGMVAIADQGEGKLPAHLGDFFNFLIDQTIHISYADVAKNALADSATQLVQGAGKVADAAGGALVSTITMLPFLLGGAFLLVIFLKEKHA